MSDFLSALLASGLRPATVAPDGRWHRCPTEDKPHRRNGVFKLDIGGATGVFRNYAMDADFNFWRDCAHTAKNSKRCGDTLDALRRMSAQDEHRRASRSAEARRFWGAAPPLLGAHPYLSRKLLSTRGCEGLRRHRDLLLVPVERDGEVISVQAISPSGQKRFFSGAPIKGGRYVINRPSAALTCLVEGFATGLAVYQCVSQCRVVVAFDCANLAVIAPSIKWRPLVICADNDHATQARIGRNPGMEAAQHAAKLTGAAIAAPSGINGSDWADALREWGEGAANRIGRAILASLMEPAMS